MKTMLNICLTRANHLSIGLDHFLVVHTRSKVTRTMTNVFIHERVAVAIVVDLLLLRWVAFLPLACHPCRRGHLRTTTAVIQSEYLALSTQGME